MSIAQATIMQSSYKNSFPPARVSLSLLISAPLLASTGPGVNTTILRQVFPLFATSLIDVKDPLEHLQSTNPTASKHVRPKQASPG
jgi:hypothetical protein